MTRCTTQFVPSRRADRIIDFAASEPSRSVRDLLHSASHAPASRRCGAGRGMTSTRRMPSEERLVMVRAALVVFALLAVGPVAAQAAERASDESGAPGAGDPLDRGSPRETVAGFLDATDRADDRRARDYLDLSGLPAARRDEAARELRTVLDRQVWIDLDAL